jgi:hypothetical protein
MLLCHLSVYLYILSLLFCFIFCLSPPCCSAGKINGKNMMTLVQIFHEFATTAFVEFKYVTVRNIVTVIQFTVLGQKGRLGE